MDSISGKEKIFTKPAWFKEGRDRIFYIRTGQTTHPLDAKEVLEYVVERFKKYK